MPVVTPSAAFHHDYMTDSTESLELSAVELAELGAAQLSWYVYQAVLDARFNMAGLEFVGETVVGGTPHRIVRFHRSDGREVTLAVDPATARVARRTTRQTRQTGPPISYVYGDYQEVDGLPVPHAVTMYEGERLAARYDVLQLLFNVELNEEAFVQPG